jgi:hypothetical protein
VELKEQEWVQLKLEQVLRAVEMVLLELQQEQMQLRIQDLAAEAVDHLDNLEVMEEQVLF